MNLGKVLKMQPESFALLVKRLKVEVKNYDTFEIDLDTMKVKGDLAVIQKYFKKPFIAKSQSLDLLKRTAKAGFVYIIVPDGMETDLDFKTITKNKGTVVLTYSEYN
jgi:hypothetical protein